MGADLDFYDDEVDVEDVEAAKDGGIDDESAKPYPDHHRLHPNCCKPSQLLLLLLTQHKWQAAWALKWALDGSQRLSAVSGDVASQERDGRNRLIHTIVCIKV